MDFFARAVGNIEQHLGGIGHALDRSHHLVDGGGGLAHAGGLGLRALHHVLHVPAHLVHRAGATVISFASGSVMEAAVRYAIPMPTPSASSMLTNETRIVQLAAVSSDLCRSSTIFLFSLSAASRYSVVFFTQDEASFWR